MKPGVDHFGSSDELQDYLLQGVSRTFALTIPQLPADLKKVVSNAYLLCRIVDTIEDEPKLTFEQKKYFADQFVSIVEKNTSAAEFSQQLSPLLSDSTIPEEHELIKLTPDVILITHNFNKAQQNALACCVHTMAEGMIEFQQPTTEAGLDDMPHMDRYCYYVAGVVGEMLAKLFCDYSSEIAKHKDDLLKLSVSFGQGLQMTNILKDIWDDQHRGACWLPRSVFKKHGFDLNTLSPDQTSTDFESALGELIGIAHGHLKNALKYTLLIPDNEQGIRKFCLWAIGMALLTLCKINKQRNFKHSDQVKISRRSVKTTILGSNLAVRQDILLKLLFSLTSSGLPLTPQE